MPAGVVEAQVTVEKLLNGDVGAALMVGATSGKSLQEKSIAVFMADVLGNVHLMHPDSVEVKTRPRVSDDDLDKLEEAQAIQVKMAEGAGEDEIMQYLSGRDERRG